LHRRGRGGARAPIEERELAEEVTLAHDRDERLLSEFPRKRDLHRAIQDDVQVRARIVLSKERLAPFEGSRARPLGEGQQLRVGELCEQGITPEMLGQLWFGHGASLRAWFGPLTRVRAFSPHG